MHNLIEIYFTIAPFAFIFAILATVIITKSMTRDKYWIEGFKKGLQWKEIANKNKDRR